MRNTLTFTLILTLLIVLPILASDNQNKVCFKKHCFVVELATTAERREQGLMFCESLGFDKGMLFIFPQEQAHSFWMKNTYIPLDIIWINRNKEVVFIKENAQPCLGDNCPIIDPGQAAVYVLEVSAGMTRQIGLEVGEEVSFHIGENYE